MLCQDSILKHYVGATWQTGAYEVRLEEFIAAGAITGVFKATAIRHEEEQPFTAVVKWACHAENNQAVEIEQDILLWTRFKPPFQQWPEVLKQVAIPLPYYFSYGHHEGKRFLLIEYVEGFSPLELLEQPLPEPIGLYLLWTILAAIYYAAERGYLNVDLQAPRWLSDLHLPKKANLPLLSLFQAQQMLEAGEQSQLTQGFLRWWTAAMEDQALLSDEEPTYPILIRLLDWNTLRFYSDVKDSEIRQVLNRVAKWHFQFFVNYYEHTAESDPVAWWEKFRHDKRSLERWKRLSWGTREILAQLLAAAPPPSLGKTEWTWDDFKSYIARLYEKVEFLLRCWAQPEVELRGRLTELERQRLQSPDHWWRYKAAKAILALRRNEPVDVSPLPPLREIEYVQHLLREPSQIQTVQNWLTALKAHPWSQYHIFIYRIHALTQDVNRLTSEERQSIIEYITSLEADPKQAIQQVNRPILQKVQGPLYEEFQLLSDWIGLSTQIQYILQHASKTGNFEEKLKKVDKILRSLPARLQRLQWSRTPGFQNWQETVGLPSLDQLTRWIQLLQKLQDPQLFEKAETLEQFFKDFSEELRNPEIAEIIWKQWRRSIEAGFPYTQEQLDTMIRALQEFQRITAPKVAREVYRLQSFLQLSLQLADMMTLPPFEEPPSREVLARQWHLLSPVEQATLKPLLALAYHNIKGKTAIFQRMIDLQEDLSNFSESIRRLMRIPDALKQTRTILQNAQKELRNFTQETSFTDEDFRWVMEFLSKAREALQSRMKVLGTEKVLTQMLETLQDLERAFAIHSDHQQTKKQKIIESLHNIHDALRRLEQQLAQQGHRFIQHPLSQIAQTLTEVKNIRQELEPLVDHWPGLTAIQRELAEFIVNASGALAQWKETLNKHPEGRIQPLEDLLHQAQAIIENLQKANKTAKAWFDLRDALYNLLQTLPSLPVIPPGPVLETQQVLNLVEHLAPPPQPSSQPSPTPAYRLDPFDQVLTDLVLALPDRVDRPDQFHQLQTRINTLKTVLQADQSSPAFEEQQALLKERETFLDWLQNFLDSWTKVPHNRGLPELRPWHDWLDSIKKEFQTLAFDEAHPYAPLYQYLKQEFDSWWNWCQKLPSRLQSLLAEFRNPPRSPQALDNLRKNLEDFKEILHSDSDGIHARLLRNTWSRYRQLYQLLAALLDIYDRFLQTSTHNASSASQKLVRLQEVAQSLYQESWQLRFWLEQIPWQRFHDHISVTIQIDELIGKIPRQARPPASRVKSLRAEVKQIRDTLGRASIDDGVKQSYYTILDAIESVLERQQRGIKKESDINDLRKVRKILITLKQEVDDASSGI